MCLTQLYESLTAVYDCEHVHEWGLEIMVQSREERCTLVWVLFNGNGCMHVCARACEFTVHVCLLERLCFHWLSWPVCALITVLIPWGQLHHCICTNVGGMCGCFRSKSLSGLKRCDGFGCIWERKDLLKTLVQHLQLYCEFACFTNLSETWQDKTFNV